MKLGKICDMLARSDNRVTVIHKKNGGLSDARNAGLDRATGELIGFVDSDDYIEKNMYEVLEERMRINEADISCCGRYVVQESDRKRDILSWIENKYYHLVRR